MAENIKVYMQKDDEDVVYDLEDTFLGLKYAKCTGLLTYGKVKNVYTESFADSPELRVWQGENVVREATTITLTLYFIGENRQESYHEFYNYVCFGKHYYWDTARKLKAYLVLIDAVTVKEDTYKGSTPYIAVDFKFQNLWGFCHEVEIE